MRFLVPLDVRGCADKVMDRALWLARMSGAKLDLMTVIPHIDAGVRQLELGERAVTLDAVLDDETAALLRGFAIHAARNAMLGDVIVHHGNPTEEILRVVAERRPQLLIMGSHARTGVRRALFGSVAEAVMRQAQTPVLIEPAGRDLEEHPSSVALHVEAESCG